MIDDIDDLLQRYLSDFAEEDFFYAPPEEPEAKCWLSPKEITEANKTRETCISCGNKTTQKDLLSSVVNYCPCVD